MVAPGAAQRGDQIAAPTPLSIVRALLALRRWTPTLWGAWLLLACIACDGDGIPLDGGPSDAGIDPPADDDGPPRVRARFDLGPAPMALGAIPWPDDLYLDASGRIAVANIDAPTGDELAEACADLDGFGVRPVVRFAFDEPIDPSSLPETPEDTLPARAPVFLLDADTGSPQAFQRIAADVRYDEERQEILVRAAHGRPLVQGRRYAAVVTRDVDSQSGRALEGARRFVAIRDPEQPLQDALERRARDQYSPVLETLASQGVPRDSVVAMAVFRVQSIGTDLADAHALVAASVAPSLRFGRGFVGDEALDDVLGTPAAGSVGVDAPGGAPHGQLGALVHGSFSAPNLVSATVGGFGAFMRDAAGLVQKRVERVPFTLLLPRLVDPGLPLPVVLVQHGLGGDRSDALALANQLAASGYASLTIDAPHHGTRDGGEDTVGRFSGLDEPDGFGDVPGELYGAQAQHPELGPMHPFFYRDAVRQGAVSLMAAVRALAEGDWSELAAADPSLDGVVLDGTRIGFVGIDAGAEMGAMLAIHEPRVGALVLGFADALGAVAWLESPVRSEHASALLEHLDIAQAEQPVWEPAFDVFRMLGDRGVAVGHAAALRRSRANVLLLMAVDDERSPNRGSEAFALAIGAEALRYMPRYVPDLPSRVVLQGDTRSANFDVDDAAVTRALMAFDPATHSSLVAARGLRYFERPLVPPFLELEEPEVVDNPIAALLTSVGFFFQSWQACVPGMAGNACAASVMLPDLR